MDSFLGFEVAHLTFPRALKFKELQLDSTSSSNSFCTIAKTIPNATSNLISFGFPLVVSERVRIKLDKSGTPENYENLLTVDSTAAQIHKYEFKFCYVKHHLNLKHADTPLKSRKIAKRNAIRCFLDD